MARTLKARPIAGSLRTAWAGLTLTLGILTSGGVFADDPAGDHRLAIDIQSLRQSILRQKEQLESWDDDRAATIEALARMRADMLFQIKTVTRLERDAGVHAGTPGSDAASRRILEDLSLARVKIVVLKRQWDLTLARLADERKAAAARIGLLEAALATAAAEIERFHEERMGTRAPSDRSGPAASAEAGLDESGAASQPACSMERADADRRPAVPLAKAWRALDAENKTLMAENMAMKDQLTDATEIAEQCIARTRHKDESLARALRQIEALAAGGASVAPR